MNPELQNMYSRAVLLEGSSNAAELMKNLYKSSSDPILRKRDYDVALKYESDLKGLIESSIVHFRGRIDTLRQKYELVDDVASARTTFEKEYEKYFLLSTGIIRKTTSRRAKIKEANENFFPCFNACQKEFGLEQFGIDDYQKDTKTGAIIETIFPTLTAFYSFINLGLAMFPMLGSVFLISVFETAKNDYRIDDVRNVDSKMKALYDF